MSVFLSLLSDSDLEVRKASLLMVNAATHHHTDVIIPFLRDQVNGKRRNDDDNNIKLSN